MSQDKSASSNRERIRTFLGRYADGRYRNSVVEFLPDTGTFLVLIPGDVDPFSISAQTMLTRRLLKDVGVDAEVSKAAVFNDASVILALAEALQTTLGDNLIDLTLASESEDKVDVVLFVRSENDTTTPELQKAVKRKLTSFLESYDLVLSRYFFTELADGEPTPPQILRVVYTLAPATPEEIAAALEAERVPPPTLRWLKTQLDSLFRLGMLVWEKPGFYSLTAKGSSNLPARKGRNSPDIKRALALARKKWSQ